VVRFGAEVTADRPVPSSVTVHYQTKGGRYAVTGDYAVCSIPFSVLQTVEAVKPFSRGEAARDPAAATTRRRQDPLPGPTPAVGRADGIFGGATVTDLRDPADELPDAAPRRTRAGSCSPRTPGGQDAARWGAMDEETRIEQALEDVARIHPWIGEEFEVGASHAWYDDPWARGAFALFRARAADAPPGRHRQARGPHPLCRGAHLAVPRVDPGRPGERHPAARAKSMRRRWSWSRWRRSEFHARRRWHPILTDAIGVRLAGFVLVLGVAVCASGCGAALRRRAPRRSAPTSSGPGGRRPDRRAPRPTSARPTASAAPTAARPTATADFSHASARARPSRRANSNSGRQSRRRRRHDPRAPGRPRHDRPLHRHGFSPKA
jgi:hypothetical protein